MNALFVGLSTLDIQYFTDSFPPPNVKVKTSEPGLLVGGPATNASVAFSFLGGNPVLASGVGGSHFKSFFEDDFRSNSIKHIDLYNGEGRLPVLASVITSTTNGDRNIFTHNPSDQAEVDAFSLFEDHQPELLMIDGFYPQVAETCCGEAKKRKIPIVFDGGSWKPYLNDLLSYVDYAICSANFTPPGTNSATDVFHFLKQAGVGLTAITRGGLPILTEGTNGMAEPCEVPVKSINPIDTLGAGDFFHGAFCFFLLQTKSVAVSLQKASVLASATCLHRGTREWLHKEEKSAFL